MRIISSAGTELIIGDKVAAGGEGEVFKIKNMPGMVLKTYTRKKPESHFQKIRIMSEFDRANLVKYCAWPVDVVANHATRKECGFIMPQVVGGIPIHNLYSPAHRKSEYPNLGWDFLVVTARNLAAAFNTIHSAGCVIGDVNEGNVLCTTSGSIAVIDCDSFQITSASGSTFLCEVGVSHFVPPELQGNIDFSKQSRTTNHDAFGLALLIFRLLFGGRHPFSGVPLAEGVGESLESNIKRRLYAYSDKCRNFIKPPPGSVPVNILSAKGLELFERAFVEISNRPKPIEWMAFLDEVRQNLVRCSKTKNHLFQKHNASCPWCKLSDAGIEYFISPSQSVPINSAGPFNLEAIRRSLQQQTPEPLQKYTLVSKTPKAFAPSVYVWPQVAATILVGLFMMYAIPSLILIWIGICWGVIMYSKSEVSNKILALRELESAKRKKIFLEAKSKYDGAYSYYLHHSNQNALQSTKDKIRTAIQTYERLDEVLNRRIDQLKISSRERQFAQFLRSFYLDRANLTGIGPTKLSILQSFGIETAADITPGSILGIRGFGPVTFRTLDSWRSKCAAGFKYNPNNLEIDTEIKKAKSIHEQTKATLEREMREWRVALDKNIHECRSSDAKVRSIVDDETEKLSQAFADYKLLSPYATIHN